MHVQSLTRQETERKRLTITGEISTIINNQLVFILLFWVFEITNKQSLQQSRRKDVYH